MTYDDRQPDSGAERQPGGRPAREIVAPFGGDGGTRGDRQGATLPTREECLRGLALLAGLVAMKVLTPAQANSIRGVYDSMLRELAKASPDGQVQLSAEVLGELRRTPRLLTLLSPLLTDEQLHAVLEGFQDARPE